MNFDQFVVAFDDLLWSPIPALANIPVLGWLSPLAILLVGTGVWFTVKTGFIQIRGFGKGMRLVFGGLFKKSDKAGKDGMSSFQALCTAIAAQVGTGNIVGASTAIAVGGPGAIFWMWVAAFFGMATIFIEATLAQKYKQVGEDGQVTGGPVYYIKEAYKGPFGKFLAGLFAVLIILSLGLMGCAVQSNGIASAWQTVANDFAPQSANMVVLIVGIILAVAAFAIFFGGVSAIASFTEKVVPAMAVVYIVGSLIVIIAHIGTVPAIFGLIFKGAFNGQAIAGGAAGWLIKNALSKGVARGLFSNEAGMGSTPHAHAVAKVDHPAEQGYTAMIGVFIDTFIILDLTAFVVIGSYIAPNVAQGNEAIFADGGLALTGAALAQAGFQTLYGTAGNIFVAFCLTFFAFSTVIGWYFFGEANWRYLFGTKTLKIYSVLVAICVFLGAWVITAGVKVETIWTLQDALNGLMVIPNLLGILALTAVAVALLKDNIEKKGLK